MVGVFFRWTLVVSALAGSAVADENFIHVEIDVAGDDNGNFGSLVTTGDGTAFPLVDFASDRYADAKLHGLVAGGVGDSAPRRVWAIGKETEEGLFFLEGSDWRRAELGKVPPDIYPDSIVSSDNGGVLVLWRQRGERPMLHLGEHKKDEHKILFSVPDSIPGPIVSQMSGGEIFVTGESATVVRFSGEGAFPVVKELPDEVFYPLVPYDNGNVSDGFTPIRVVEDGQGKYWFWSQTMHPENRDKRLKGALTLVGEDKLVSEKLPFAGPENPVIWIEERGKGRMFFAVAGGGFFDFGLSEEEEIYGASSLESLRYIERAFEAGGERYLIATPRPTDYDVEMSKAMDSILSVKKTLFYNPGEETSTLFLVDGEEIVTLTRKLDDEPDFRWFDRPVVETEDGFWLCTKRGKLAFVPFGREVDISYLTVDHGLPLDNPRYLAPVGDSTMIALDPSSGRCCLVPMTPPANVEAIPRPEILKTNSMLIEDRKGRVFGWMEKGEKFRMRENGAWKDLPLPDSDVPTGSLRLAVDGHGRGWLVPENDRGAAVFDPEEEKWSIFDSFREALETEMKQGDRLRVGDYFGHMPVSSATEPPRICFVGLDGNVRYFDQNKWRQFPLSKVTGRDSKIWASPFFEGDSELVLPIDDWLWKSASGEKAWKPEKPDNDDGRVPLYLGDRPELPEGIDVSGLVAGKISGAAYDRFGVCWISDSGGGVWKAIPGTVVSAFREGEERPLRKGDRIHEVVVDGDGTAFLRLEFGFGDGRHAVIPGFGPVPVAGVEVVTVDGDEIRFRFNRAFRHRWRIDGGEWSVATGERNVAVSGLVPGKHLLEVRAWSEELRASGNTATVEFEIAAMDASELGRMLAVLEGDELSKKEKAVDRIASQGEAIVPQLREAKKEVDGSTQWWIDAILQEIERSAE